MYELWIKDKSNNYQLADLGDIDPAMTYGINDIAELSSRQANISMTIKLPRTPNNSKIFDYSDLLDSFSNFPYNTHDCRLYSNSHELAGNGSYLIIKKVTDTHFETQIKGGGATFFDKLKKGKMSDNEHGTIILGQKTFLDGYADGNYVIPLATYQKKTERVASTHPQYCLPAFFVGSAVKKIIQGQHGYTLKSNLDDKWGNMAIAVTGTKVIEPHDHYNIKLYLKDIKFPLAAVPMAALLLNLESGNKSLYNFISEPLVGNTRGYSNNCHFTYPGKAKIQAQISITPTEGGNVQYIRCFIVLYDSKGKLKQTVIDHTLQTPQYSKTYNWSSDNENFEFKVGDILKCYMLAGNSKMVPGITADCYATISIKDIEAKSAPDSGIVRIAENTGFDSQFDFIKAISQALGIIVNAIEPAEGKESGGVVEMYTMDKLYDNKNHAVDWTDKLHTKGTETEFTIRDYAQENRVLLQENKDDEYTDIGSFTINNKSLDAQKDFFTVPFESGVDNSSNKFRLYPKTMTTLSEEKYTIPNIPRYTEIWDDNDNFTWEMVDGKPHILKMNTGYINVGINRYPVYFAKHYTAQQMIDDGYYSEQKKNMVYQAKMLTAEFLLDEADIEKYNQWHGSPLNCSGAFIPVYLQQTGAYYYVNSIHNFRNGNLTKVELVKL